MTLTLNDQLTKSQNRTLLDIFYLKRERKGKGMNLPEMYESHLCVHIESTLVARVRVGAGAAQKSKIRRHKALKSSKMHLQQYKFTDLIN